MVVCGLNSVPPSYCFETGSPYVALVGLELTEIDLPLPLPLECWDYRCVLPCLACLLIIIYCHVLYVVSVLLVCMQVLRMCAMLTEVRRGHRISWIWSYEWLVTTMWVLGMEPGSSARAASALNNHCLRHVWWHTL